MKNYCTVLLILFGFASALSGQKWSAARVNYDRPILGTDVHTVDENVAWTIGTDGQFDFLPYWDKYDTAPFFARTSDGGMTWINGSYPSTGAGYPTNVFGVDELTAWITYNDYEEGVKVFYTEDGGESWENIETGITTWVNLIHFFDAENGVAMGDPDEEGFQIVITNDGGHSWTRVDPSSLPGVISTEIGISNVFQASGDELIFDSYIVDEEGNFVGDRFHYTSDKGNSWKVVNAPLYGDPVAGNLYSLAKKGDRIICIYNYPVFEGDFTNRAFRSDDNGNTWKELSQCNNLGITDYLKFIPGTEILMGAFARTYSHGPFFTYASFDYGDSWVLVDKGTRLYDIDFVNDHTGFGSEYENDNGETAMYTYTGPPISTLECNGSLVTLKYKFPNGSIDGFVPKGAALNINKSGTIPSKPSSSVKLKEDEQVCLEVGSVWTLANRPDDQTIEGERIYRSGYYTSGGMNGNVVTNKKPSCLTLIYDKEDVAEFRSIGAKTFAEDNISPNPFYSQITVNYTLEFPSEVRMVLYDLTGREVKVLINTHKGAGAYSDSYDLNEIPSGTYSLLMSYDSKLKKEKIVKIK